jgi:hypothetical protein
LKKTTLDKAVTQFVDVTMSAIDKFIDQIIEPLEVTENPEKMIGKPYESWTQQDLQALTAIYGTGADTPLSRFIFNKTYEKVTALESGEKQYG